MDFKINTDPVTRTIFTVLSPQPGSTVSPGDTRMCLNDGNAFFDASRLNLNYPGAKIEVVSISTGKKAVGYIRGLHTGQDRFPAP